MGLMKGKRGLIMGLANDKSLAWGIAKALHAQGAELAISYQGEVMEKRVKPLADQLGCDFLIDCDVADMDNLDAAFATLAARWPTIDFVVHAISYSEKNELLGPYLQTSRRNFALALDISCYSFTAVAQRLARLFRLDITALDEPWARRDYLVGVRAQDVPPAVVRRFVEFLCPSAFASAA